MTGFRINDNRRTFVLKPKVIRMYYCCCCQQKKISIYILLVCTVVKKWTVVFARLRTVLARVHCRTFANASCKISPSRSLSERIQNVQTPSTSPAATTAFDVRRVGFIIRNCPYCCSLCRHDFPFGAHPVRDLYGNGSRTGDDSSRLHAKS